MRLRSLHVIDSLGPGGAETSLVDLTARLADAGDEPHIAIFKRWEPDLLSKALDAGVPVHVLQGPSRLSRIHQLAALATTLQPSLVHSSLVEADLVTRAAVRGSMPTVTSLVNDTYGPDARPSSAARRAKLGAYRRADAWTARRWSHRFHSISQAVAEAAFRDLKIEPSRLTVIPRGRPPAGSTRERQRERQRLRRELGLQDEDRLVLTVGRQDPQKGHDRLLAAARLLEEPIGTDGRWLVAIAGREGHATRDIQRLSTDSPGRVRVLGHRGDVRELLAAADVFAFPSRYEGLGGAVIEAMSFGLPIVASDIPALREVLDHGRCGRLVDGSDAQRFASSIATLGTNHEVAAPLGAAALARFNDMYEIDHVFKRMQQMLHETAAADPTDD